MSFFKKLFGGKEKGGFTSGGGGAPVAEATHEGFQIATMPMEEGRQFRVSALITKEVDGTMKEHRLIRADMCSTADEASDIAMRKARQVIDERGEGVFG